ncbi:MAG: ABC transporter permease [Candidatus Omnitrophota bacterium]|nr:ABC transporter permease [Candidatus Omnitrophota bacterium]
MREWINSLGIKALNFFIYIGGIFNLMVSTVFQALIPPFRKKEWVIQMYKIGVMSFPIVFLVAFFTGMVLALQSAYQLTKMNAQMYISSLVALSMLRELGPVLTALVIAGRVGASITAELGTMKVSEQIDALRTLAANPVKYLVVPRFLALCIMLPLLTIYADFIGIIGGYMIGVYKLLIGSTIYWKMTFDTLAFKDIFTGLFKSFIFAVIICVVACYEGFVTEGGAEGVGKATTRSVVISFILVIAADCLFTALFYFIFP